MGRGVADGRPVCALGAGGGRGEGPGEERSCAPGPWGSRPAPQALPPPLPPRCLSGPDGAEGKPGHLRVRGDSGPPPCSVSALKELPVWQREKGKTTSPCELLSPEPRPHCEGAQISEVSPCFLLRGQSGEASWGGGCAVPLTTPVAHPASQSGPQVMLEGGIEGWASRRHLVIAQ